LQLFSRFHLQPDLQVLLVPTGRQAFAMIMKVAAAVRFLLVVLAVTAVAARDLRQGEHNDD